ncbi:hypothetical protein RirG_269870 [Rhizophagus irregularis DAOM 197198w]|nr:hypothetical protein RirG_269870 [Rhizophagus irregularis DAOM 197198w]
MIVSIISYKIRKTHASSILKIIFNFGQIVRNSGVVGIYITPKVPTILQCAASLYITYIGNIISRLSLTAFLLWRIRQIDMKRKVWDKRICILLFVIRTAFTIPYLIFQQITTQYVSESETSICSYDYLNIAPYGIGGIVTDFLIDTYVTTRLILILKNANKNASQLSLNIRSKRTLFTAVTYWNFLRLIISFIFHLFAILDIFYLLEEGPSMTVKCIIYILLSYVITIDAEIVHVIEGKGQQNGSSTKTVKSIQSTDDHISSTLSSSDQTHSQIIDNDKIIVVSMKKLSFFECASTVLKNEDENDENHGDDEIKDDDEIKVDDESNDDDQKINDTLKESSNMEIIIH